MKRKNITVLKNYAERKRNAVMIKKYPSTKVEGYLK